MNKDYKANVESILLGYYIKYTKLEELTTNTLANTDYGYSNTVDVYIDLYDMLHNLYTTDIYANKQFTIVSSIINLAAHMRGFYWSRYNVNSRIYLVYADETSNNHKQFYFQFGDAKFKESRNYEKINSIIESQLNMVKILSAYIYGVYYIRRSTDFSMFTYDNIMKNHDIPSIIITKSKYAYQIPAMCNNAILYRPKKHNGEDSSYAVTHSNALYWLCTKLSGDTVHNQIKDMNPNIMSLLMALNGLPSKKVITLFNITTAVGRLNNAIRDHKIINGYNTDIEYVYAQLELFSKIDSANFKYRFYAIDLVYQHRLYCNMAESKDISWVIDLNDPDTVRDINNKYFIDNPLDLNNL